MVDELRNALIGVAEQHYPDGLAVEEVMRVVRPFLDRQQADLTQLAEVLRVIMNAARGDEKSECWSIRKWLDDHGVFNGDLQSENRLIEEACKAALKDAKEAARE